MEISRQYKPSLRVLAAVADSPYSSILACCQPPVWWRAWSRAAANLVFPPVCTACGEPCPERDETCAMAPLPLCPLCLSQLSPQVGVYCQRCAMPCPDLPSPDGGCPDCRGRKLAFAAARTLGVYQGALRGAVLRIKHAQQEPLAHCLGEILATVVRNRPFPQLPELIAPVPMHWRKRLWHGASAAETLADSLAVALQLPLAADLLYCTRPLQKQGTLPVSARLDNVRGAFSTSRAFDIRDAIILLADDVITTGATADQCSRALLAAGAKEVYVAAVARGTGVR